MRGIERHCKSIGLNISTKCVNDILANFSGDVKVGSVVAALAQLEKTIRWEMEERLFMFIPQERAVYFDQSGLFGEDVNFKFPELQFDIVEAGNSYASGRGTACVFHLMRVMEFGVQNWVQFLASHSPPKRIGNRFWKK